MTSEPFSVETKMSLEMKPVKLDNHQTIVAGITTRRGGVSNKPFESLNMGFHVHDDHHAVLENRKRLAEDIGISLEHWVAAEQVHGTNLVRVTSQDTGKGAKDMASAVKDTDGLYTVEDNVLLTACYADCVPIYFYSEKKPAAGLLHAGWRGTVGQGAGKMVKAWERELDIMPSDIHAIIGPSIGQCCYEVDERIIQHIRDIEHVSLETVAEQVDHNHYMLNLKELNKQILLSSGVPESHIQVSSYCTSCRNDLFFSYRAENGKTGRILSYIGLIKGDRHRGSIR
ncbi:YfiH family protein [Scopulibacillus daqui]|uniref:Purine nucleoside phosphorylase n=1 Tax=Scopulibacillus daqui TaxID=1469162 RepID=A0ABS2PXG8_9BACL|nr:peptidoglycan editing factor PgeF [Scopulibacillus daqui]MBM7644280.1 YfiH family protein [Scopulibacillus daqui]